MGEVSEQPEFKVGDVVFLKSGGPGMVVEMIRTPGIIMVLWLDAEDCLRRLEVAECCLKSESEVPAE